MMKHILFTAFFFWSTTIALSQFDDKFYDPSKTMEPISASISTTELFYKIDADTLSVLVLNPLQKPTVNVLYFHGAGGNNTNYISFVKPLLDQNYRIYMIDFRGYGKSTGKPTHVNIQQDAQIIYGKLKKKMGALPLLVYGTSMGGQIAAKFTSDNSKSVTALVLDGTFTSFTDVAVESAPEDQHQVIRQFVTSPYSAIESIKNLNGVPVLIIHSEEDTKISFTHAQKLFEAASNPKFFWKYKGEHLYAPVLETDEFIRQIFNLLNFKP